mgnify:CR=1 FL=1
MGDGGGGGGGDGGDGGVGGGRGGAATLGHEVHCLCEICSRQKRLLQWRDEMVSALTAEQKFVEQRAETERRREALVHQRMLRRWRLHAEPVAELHQILGQAPSSPPASLASIVRSAREKPAGRLTPKSAAKLQGRKMGYES